MHTNRFLLLIGLWISLCTTSYALVASGYETALQRVIEEIEQTTTSEAMREGINRLERMALAEPKAWLPQYYTAYYQTLYSFRLEGSKEKDQWLEKARQFADRAAQLAPKNASDQAEMAVLEAFIANARVAVSPGVRWMTDGKQMDKALAKAKQFDVRNPRIYYLEGISTYYTPAMFGGGCDKARPVLEKALALYAAHAPTSPLVPQWGQAQTRQAYEKCKE